MNNLLTNSKPLELPRKTQLICQNLPNLGPNLDSDSLCRNALFLSYYSQTPSTNLDLGQKKIQASLILRNMKMLELSGQIHSELVDLGVPFLTLKGLSFAQQYYGSISNRECSDIDLLVKAEHIEAVIARLKRLEFFEQQTLSPLAKKIERWGQHAFTLVQRDSGIEVDIHWRLAQRQFALPDFCENIWQQAIEVEIENVKFFSPSAIDCLRIVATSGIKDCWSMGRCLLDLSQCLEQISTQELEDEISRFVKLGIGATLATPLKFLQNVIPTNHINLDQLETKYYKHFLSVAASSPNELTTFKTHLLFQETFIGKIKYSLARLLIPHLSDWDSSLGSLGVIMLKPFKTVYLALHHLLKKKT